MTETGKYLYAIIPCDKERPLDVAGMDDMPVHTICYGGIGAVVSDSLLPQYEGTRKNLLAHERVLENAMKEFTLLPVRFGTVADSGSGRHAVEELLETRSPEFQKLLQDMAGKVELGLKAFWREEKAIFEEIVSENEDIRRLRNSLSRKAAESAYFDKAHLGEMVKAALNRKRAKEATEILTPLRPLARSVKENTVLADRMVVNAAFLVEKERGPEFDRAVTRLDERFGGRIAFRYIGPVPPYNFVNIVVNWKSQSRET